MKKQLEIFPTETVVKKIITYDSLSLHQKINFKANEYTCC